MKRNAGPLILTLIVLFFLGFLGCGLYSWFTIPDKELLKQFLGSWTLSSTILLFIRLFLPLQITAVVLYFSLILPESKTFARLKSKSASAIVSNYIVVFLFTTLCYFSLAEGVQPVLKNKQRVQLEMTKLAIYSKEKGIEHDRNGRIEEAKREYERYLLIDPRDLEGFDIQSRLEKLPYDMKKPPKEQQMTDDMPELSRSMLNKAQDYFDIEDYFSAHYYASVALRQLHPQKDKAFYEKALMIQKESTWALERRELSKEELEDKEFFQNKKRGKELFTESRDASDPKKLLEAFYLFQRLKSERPDDRDVQNYSMWTESALMKEAFLLQEALTASAAPGKGPLMFKNTPTEMISARKMVSLDMGVYLYDVEIIDRGRYHIRAPYGKVLSSGEGGATLLLHAVDPDSANNNRSADLLYGERIAPDQIPLTLAPRHLAAMSLVSTDLSTRPIAAPWADRKVVTDHGHSILRIDHEIITRLMEPFTVLLLSLLFAALGWRLRVQKNRRYRWTYFFCPLIPPASYFLSDYFQSTQELVAGRLILSTDLFTSIALLVLTNLVLFGTLLGFIVGSQRLSSGSSV